MQSKNYKKLKELLKGNPEALKCAAALHEELENESFDIDYPELSDEIDCGIGNIEYQTNNMVLDQIMVALGENIKRSNPQAVLNLLESVNQYA